MSLEKTCDHVTHVQLRVSSTEDHQVLHHCAGCRARQPFRCSGKFRVNANGKTLDIWLIYRCTVCDQTWNYPIHERIAVRALDPHDLGAFMQNDAELAARYADDADRLRMFGAQSVRSSDAVITRVVQQRASKEPRLIVVSVTLTTPCALRLDRLMALGLSLPRADIKILQAMSALTIHPHGAKALKKVALDGQVLRLDLAACPTPVADRCRQAAEIRGVVEDVD